MQGFLHCVWPLKMPYSAAEVKKKKVGRPIGRTGCPNDKYEACELVTFKIWYKIYHFALLWLSLSSNIWKWLQNEVSPPPPKKMHLVLCGVVYTVEPPLTDHPDGHKMWSVKDRWSLMAVQQKDQNLTFLDHVDTSRFFHFGEDILEWMLLSHYHDY